MRLRPKPIITSTALNIRIQVTDTVIGAIIKEHMEDFQEIRITIITGNKILLSDLDP